MNTHLHILFAPMLPPSILMGLGVIAVLLTVYGIAHSAKGMLLRSGVMALLILTLANPSVVREQREALHDTALVVIDDSASMGFGNRAEQTRHASEALTEKLKALPDLDVETLHVRGDDQTNLFEAISGKLSSLPKNCLAGIIALTDGQVHDAPTTPLDIPFHALIAGHKNEIDRRLSIKAAPAYGIVGKKIDVTLRVDDQPTAQTEKAVLTFRSDDNSSQSITVPVGKDIPFSVPITHAGQNLFAFHVEPLPNELTEINNDAAVTVNGIRDRLRVLLVSGAPHIGGRTWRNYLKADPAVDLVHFTILRTPEKNAQAAIKDMALITFPTHQLFDEKLKDFDLVIFDRFSNRSLIPDEYLDNIANYVEAGGALLVSNTTDDVVNGMSASPLARILPTQATGKILTGEFVPDLSEAGQKHPVTATLTRDHPRAAWGPWFRQAEGMAQRGEILMTGLNKAPLLVLDHVGKGRVAQILSDQFWLWARGYDKGGPQAELLRRIAHWLVQEPELDENALRASVTRKDKAWQLTITKRSLHDTEAHVTVTDTNDQSRDVLLSPAAEKGLLQNTLTVAKAGLLTIKDGDKELLVMAGAMDTPEYGALTSTADILTPLAKASGGSVIWLDDAPDAPSVKRTDVDGSQNGWGWIGLRRNGQYRVTGSEALPLWPAWLALIILLGAMMFGWRREGRS